MNFIQKRRLNSPWFSRLRVCLVLMGLILLLGWGVNATRAVKPQQPFQKMNVWFVLEPESEIFFADEEIELKMFLEDENGRSTDLTSKTNFEKMGDVNGSLIDNVYRPALVGQTTIIGTVFGQRLEVQYEIQPGSAVSMELDPSSVTLEIGAVQSYSLNASDEDKNIFDVTTEASWFSDGGGTWLNNTFTAATPGYYTIQAKAAGLESTGEVTILEPEGPAEDDPPNAPESNNPEPPPNEPVAPTDPVPPSDDSLPPPEAGETSPPNPNQTPLAPASQGEGPPPTPLEQTVLPLVPEEKKESGLEEVPKERMVKKKTRKPEKKITKKKENPDSIETTAANTQTSEIALVAKPSEDRGGVASTTSFPTPQANLDSKEADVPSVGPSEEAKEVQLIFPEVLGEVAAASEQLPANKMRSTVWSFVFVGGGALALFAGGLMWSKRKKAA